MKKKMVKMLVPVLITVLFLAILLLWHCKPDTSLPMTAINAQDAFHITLECKKRIIPHWPDKNRGYASQQGSATDGTHAYILMENGEIDRCAIHKLDLKTWKTVASQYDLDLDHGNDMTYHPGLQQLLVVHNKPHYTRVSFVDPDTLEVTGRKTMPYQIYSMAYEPSRDQYVVGISSTYDFAVLDNAFKKVVRYKGVNTGLVKQGVDCDERYIYFPQNTEDARENVLMVYDWEGRFVTRVPVDSRKEIESLFHVDDDWYIAFQLFGSHVYRAVLQKN